MDKKHAQLTSANLEGFLATQSSWSNKHVQYFAQPEASSGYSDGPPDPSSSNIVVVDDNEADLFFTAMLLKSKGFFSIRQFHSGAEMVQAYKQGLPCDILFMDVRMPQMDGFDTVEALSKTKRWDEAKPIVYMVSAAANAEDRKRAEEHAAISELARKPLSADALANLVKRAE